MKRFWDKVEKSESTNGCWLWKASCSRGYGCFANDGRNHRSHRFAYELATGEKLSRDMQILHSCDNKLCVNPFHLRIGTHEDNMRDMTSRHRQAIGARCGAAKLTPVEVSEIRRLLSEGVPQRQVAGMYSVSQRTVLGIKQGSTWREVA